jgi:hypothetical protein
LARPVACTASPLLKPKASLTGRGPGLATAARDKSSWCVLLCLLKVGAAGIKQGASCLRRQAEPPVCARTSLCKNTGSIRNLASHKRRERELWLWAVTGLVPFRALSLSPSSFSNRQGHLK